MTRTMIVTETELPGAYVIDLEPIEDPRGFFARAWSDESSPSVGSRPGSPSATSRSTKRKGTVRGMHFQRPPHEEVKLVRCTRGALYDVIVDLRPGSATFRRWIGVELSQDNRRALYVPRGFAHGFQTLADDTEVFYMISEPYAPESAGGVRWDDPAFGIVWPLGDPTEISDKDRSWPDYTGRS